MSEGYDSTGKVMRSIFIPMDMDQELRSWAFTLRRTRSDLIREFIKNGLTELCTRYAQEGRIDVGISSDCTLSGEVYDQRTSDSGSND